GPATKKQVSAIFDKRAHEEQAFRSIKGVQRLATTHGPKRLELACHRANTFGMTGLRRLKAILKSHLDEVPIVSDTSEATVLNHDNLRGQQYYS
ncbi:MAG: IS21 family transposase, partial [Cyanobacteria bacterium J06650_10]